MSGLRKKYDVPQRHRGRKFRCLHCRQKIRTTDVAPSEIAAIDDPLSRPPRFSKMRKFQKQTDGLSPGAINNIKFSVGLIFVAACIVILVVVLDNQFGFIRNASLKYTF